MKQLTKADWEAGLKKWERGENHEADCAFCSYYKNSIDRCNGCPLDMGMWPGEETPLSILGHCHKPEHPWNKWNKNKTEENALVVHDFMATKYIEWLEKNCGKYEERKPKWARATERCFDYLTKNEWYRITEHLSDRIFRIDDHSGSGCLCAYRSCAYLYGGDWELCYDDEPPVEKKEPKWAKSLMSKLNWTIGKWYKVRNIHGYHEINTNDGDWLNQGFGGPDWELSYDEEKPVEKCSKCGQVLPE